MKELDIRPPRNGRARRLTPVLSAFAAALVIACGLFFRPEACGSAAARQENSCCLAPQSKAGELVFEGRENGLLMGRVSIDPNKPTILVVASDYGSLLGPAGNTSNLFMGLRRNLPEYNVALLRLGGFSGKIYESQVRDLYGPDTGIVTPHFLYDHPEIRVDAIYMHQSDELFTAGTHDYNALKRLYSLRRVEHYASSRTPENQPSLGGKWIVPDGLPEIFFSVRDSLNTPEEQKKALFDDVVFSAEKDNDTSIQNYASRISRLDTAMLAQRTFGISYSHELTSLSRYLLMLARLSREKGMYGRGITLLVPLHPELLENFMLDALPNAKFNEAMGGLNGYIETLYPGDGSRPRVLIPNPDGEGLLYISSKSATAAVPQAEARTSDILLIPSQALPQKKGFLRAMALSALEREDWIPPLMSGDGSYTAASALEMLCGLPALHDGNIMHLWGDGQNFSGTMQFVINPDNVPVMRYIIRGNLRVQDDSPTVLEDCAARCRARLSVDTMRYARFLISKDLARHYANRIRRENPDNAIAAAA